MARLEVVVLATVLLTADIVGAEPKRIDIRLLPTGRGCEIYNVSPPSTRLEDLSDFVKWDVTSSCDPGYSLRLRGKQMHSCYKLPPSCEWTEAIDPGGSVLPDCYVNYDEPDGCYQYQLDLLDSANKVIDFWDPEVEVRRQTLLLLGGGRILLRPRVGDDGAVTCVGETTPQARALEGNPGALYWHVENRCDGPVGVKLAFAKDVSVFTCSSVTVRGESTSAIVCVVGDPRSGEYQFELALKGATFVSDGKMPVVMLP